MTKKIMCLLAGALVGVSALSAQDNVPARKQTFVKEALRNHWFVDLGWSATTPLGREQAKVDLNKRTSLVNFNLGVGRYFNPYFATRLQLQGGILEEDTRMVGDLGRSSYGLAHVDFMFDVVNFFTPYREKRFFHLIPFVGVGVGHRRPTEDRGVFDNDPRTSAIALAGLQLKLRLTSFLDFNIEGQLISHDLGGKYDANGAHWSQGIASLGAGVTFHLGKKEFEVKHAGDPSLLASLNDELNRLRAENAELSKRPERCPDLAPVVQKGIRVGNVVYFRLNSAKVDANQLINIRNIAEYAKNNTETITLVGYADRQTGTPAYNYALSERRALAVKKILVEKYGISADRIKTDWKGDREQPYDENVWNRIVIMSAED